MSAETVWLNLANLVLCSMVGWACVCRLNLLHHGVDWRPRAAFVGLLTGATAHGLAPWLFRESAGIGDTLLTLAVFASLVLSAHRWREGAPVGLTAPAKFDDQVQDASRL